MNRHFRKSSCLQNSCGFTLIEIAIGLIIIGLLAVPYMQIYRVYKEQLVYDQTTNNISAIKSALNKYAIRYGHYPLPAQPAAAADTISDGQEVTAASVVTCTTGTAAVCRTTASWGTAPNDKIVIGAVPYAAVGLPQKYSLDGYKNKYTYAVTEFMTASTYVFSNDDGIIKVIDRNDADVDGNSVPAWQFCARQDNAAPNASNTCTFPGTKLVRYGPPTQVGGIIPNLTVGSNILTLTNTTYCGDSVFGDPYYGFYKACWYASPPKQHSKHYVIISHGQDRAGAYTAMGVQNAPCPALGATKDALNCSKTSTFNNNFDTDPSGNYKRRQYTLAGTAHYDDYLDSVNTLEQDIWVQKSGSASIYSNLAAAGKVLIADLPALDATNNPIVPAARLEVRGSSNGNIKATNLLLNRLCDTAGCGPIVSPPAMPAIIPAQTFDARSIASTPDYSHVHEAGFGISCGKVGSGAQAMKGISLADEVCLDVLPGNMSIGSCPTGQISHGTDAAGKLICSTQ